MGKEATLAPHTQSNHQRLYKSSYRDELSSLMKWLAYGTQVVNSHIYSDKFYFSDLCLFPCQFHTMLAALTGQQTLNI